MNVVVRAAGDAIAVLPAVREAVRSLDADLPIYDVARLADLAARAIGDQRRSTTVLLTVLAALAIALGAIGIYGLVAYAVSQRMREMGLRLVLGATSASNVQLVVAHGIRLAIAGVAIGLGLAAIAGRLLDSLLYNVAPADPFTLAVAGAILLVVAVLASALPALRAASARPADTLREMSG
jgi:putative ABC transport system permease protein